MKSYFSDLFPFGICSESLRRGLSTCWGKDKHIHEVRLRCFTNIAFEDRDSRAELKPRKSTQLTLLGVSEGKVISILRVAGCGSFLTVFTLRCNVANITREESPYLIFHAMASSEVPSFVTRYSAEFKSSNCQYRIKHVLIVFVNVMWLGTEILR